MLISTLIPTAKSSQQRSTWKSPVIQNVQDPQKMSLAYALFGYTSPELFDCQYFTVNQSIFVVPKCYFQLANKI